MKILTEKFFISFEWLEKCQWNNIKNHKKSGFHPLFKRYIFRKITEGGPVILGLTYMRYTQWILWSSVDTTIFENNIKMVEPFKNKENSSNNFIVITSNELIFLQQILVRQVTWLVTRKYGLNISKVDTRNSLLMSSLDGVERRKHKFIHRRFYHAAGTMRALHINVIILLRKMSRWLKRLSTVIYIPLILITITTWAFVLIKTYIELIK